MISTLLLLIILTYILYKFAIRNFNYWKEKGVSYVEPIPVFGSFLGLITSRLPFGSFLAKYYNQFKAPYIGFYIFNTPYLIIKEPNLIKAILIKDFKYFCDRTFVNDVNSFSTKLLAIVKNPEWKFLRNKMTPIFTSGKIKGMLKLINEAAEDMKTYIDKNLEIKAMDVKNICAKYSTNVIASCAFGINARCFENENAEFITVGKKLFHFSWNTAFRQISYFIAPALVKLFKLEFFDPASIQFMREVFWKTVEEREKGKYERNDLIDIIIQMKNQSTANDDLKFEGDWVVSPAAQFYSAGYETVSSTLAFAIYELCLHPKMQDKLRSEIKASYIENGCFSYESIQDMKYMHVVISETLRKYPPIPFLNRKCMEDYKVPDRNLIIQKNTTVFIPVLGLHYNEEYFPNPEKFDPERFSEENLNKLAPYVYIPFGEGPRNCIGERFGMVVTKLGLAHILLQFEVERSADTPVPIEFEFKSFMLASKVSLSMKFNRVIS